MTSSRALVVTADDLGLTRGVNRAIREAHLDGVVTATSLLAVGRAFDDAASMLRATPTLELGAHLALVGEDPPLLTAPEIPTLVDRHGAFPASYRTLVARGATGRIDPQDVSRELSAQLDRILSIGLPVTHLDTHQHTHLWPAVARVVTCLATQHGIAAVRLPRSHAGGLIGPGVAVLAHQLARRLHRAGLIAPADYAGLDEAGSLTTERMITTVTALARRGASTAEINSHPGIADDRDLDRFTWGYRWSAELAMLKDPRTRTAIRDAGYRLTGFSDLQDANAVGPRPGDIAPPDGQLA